MESAIVGDKGSTTLGKNGNTKLENNSLCRCQDYSMTDGLYDNTRIAKGGTPLPHPLPRVRKHERIHHHINNGSVSCYFYDASGERTVKLTSETEMVHVNGKKVGGNDAVTKFTAYVSPYFVVSNGGAYTKHIYAASQRIASKLGNEDGFGADPRRVEMAGGKKISDIQKDNIGARYKELGFTYSAPEKEKVEKDSTMDSESEEKLIFFYHPDHLGSTSYVTDADGNIAQHVEYIPYGEVFVEERNSQFSTNFLFNAKELDNETGLYYYGARYLDPTGAMWLSVDPMWEKYAGMSPYNYCAGNPVKLVDPDGEDYVFFEENGTEIGRIVDKNQERWYALRTTQTTDEMYGVDDNPEKGNTDPILISEAIVAKDFIQGNSGKDFKSINKIFRQEYTNAIIDNFYVPIPNQMEADASFAYIGDDGSGGTDKTNPNNNMEYGWNYRSVYNDRNKVVGAESYYESRSDHVGNPRNDKNISVRYSNNHTHPSGVDGAYSWQQPPSRQDIDNSHIDDIRKVWGMRAKRIYLFDRNGVKATVPFSIYKK
jgi:RHS repeat-associated protein